MEQSAHHSVPVFRRPLVAVHSSGNELVAIDAPLKPGQIRNSNLFSLCARIESWGAIAIPRPILRDDREAIRIGLQETLELAPDAIVTTGGISAGDLDHIREIAREMGDDVQIHKVAMKPGKPLVFGRIDDIPIFGLPGNPVSSFVSFEQFVRPSIRKMMGATRLTHKIVQAKLTRSVHKKAGRLHFLSAHVQWESGVCTVCPTQEQGSGILKSTVDANGLLIFPLELTEMTAGAQVSVQMLE